MTVPRAVLFDMDGTLINTEPLWLAAQVELCADHNMVWTADMAHDLVGLDNLVGAQVMVDKGLDLSPRLIVDIVGGKVAAAVRKQVPWCVGALELLQQVRAAGIPTALVTASERFIVDALLESVDGVFDVVVSAQDVKHKKPHPEPYLRAAALLQVAPSECVAIEDSPAGVSAAYEAQTRTIAVVNYLPIAPRVGLSRVNCLAQVDLELVGRIGRGESVDLVAPKVATAN